MTDQTVRLTAAQALVTYLSRQYSVADGQRRRLIPATLGIFGHGNVAGLGQALDQLSDVMPFIQGRNEQALVHAATAFAKHSRRHATLAVTSSIGPGALNMVTGAALATVNRLPVLRPHHPARAAAHRAARGHAGAHRSGGRRRRGALAAAGHPGPRLRLPGRVPRR